MILSVFLGLMAIALGALMVPGRQKFGGTILLLGGGLFFLYQLGFPVGGQNMHWSYEWLPSAGLHSSLNLRFDSQLRQNLFPVAAAGLGMIYIALFCSAESLKRSFGALLLLSLGAFVILDSAAGLIQLMAGSCLYTVIGFYLIDRIELREKYLFYNFIAEMALFIACAVIYGSAGTVNLSKCISFYARLGEHKDFVAVLLLTAVFVKAGLFPFQNAFSDTQDMPFNRVMALTAVVAPVAGFLLFSKVWPFINAAPSINMSFALSLTGVSFLWGMWGGLLIDNLKAKTIYLNLMAFATVMAVFCENQTIVGSWGMFGFVPVLVALDCLILTAVLSASDEIYLSQMGGFVKSLKLNFVVAIMGIALLITLSARFLQNHIFQIGVGGILVVAAHILHGIYLGKTRADEHVWALLKNMSLFLLMPLALFFGWGIYDLGAKDLLSVQTGAGRTFWLEWGGFFLFLILNPLGFVLRWSDNEKLQEADPLQKIYEVLLLMPLRLLGRILWITIDFLFIERTVIASLSQATGLIVNGLHKIQTAVWLNYLLMVMVGLGFFVFFAGRYFYE